ncbi:MAG TPA: hypothetical protein VLY04_20945 [Bryobacteraceae bacterium]|nr:hypothetical protein [Bryobacteraceae bacterium]
MSRTIREGFQTALNTAVTPACLLAVLVLWPVLHMVRVLRASH